MSLSPSKKNTATSSQEKIKAQFIPAANSELFCNVTGSGNLLIVIHGGPGYLTHDYLLPHLETLAENNLVVFYDQRGLGRSTEELNLENINVQIYVEDIEAIRIFFGSKKVSLLGHSWGCFLAMHYAFIHPESINNLILVDSIPGSSEDLGLVFAEFAKRLAPYQEKLNTIESSELYLTGDPQMVEHHLKTILQTYMHNPENIDKLNLWQPQKAALNGFKIGNIFREQIFMKPYDLTERLRTLKCPTLIIHGDVDPIPFVTAENLKAAIPSAELIKIDRCGHFPFVEQPKTFFRIIKNFLSVA